MPPANEPSPRPSSDSLEDEFARLRGAVSQYPALRPIVERIPDDTPRPGGADIPGVPQGDGGPEVGLTAPPRAVMTPEKVGSEALVGEAHYPTTLSFHDYDGQTHLAPRPMRLEEKRDALRARQQMYQNAVTELNAQLKQGRIGTAEWMRRMMGEVRDLHTTAYAIGYSGRWEEIESRDWGAVGNVVQRQYRFLRSWRQEIEREGIDDVSLARLNDRAQKYGAASRESFEKGYGAEVGLPPNVLPAVPGDGSTICLTRCRCRWAINILDKQNQDFDCTWTLGVAEHCETCIDRSTEWVQLEVRDGELISDYEPIFAR